jgi:heme exporter protein D
VPIGFLGAYFGINATEVSNQWSIFDMHHYRPVYATAGCLALVPLIAFFILNGRAWLTSHQEKKKRQKQLQAQPDSNAGA